ncbi:MAG: LysM peptidoglycan-binding domain-containing protein [Mogibacterium sp.]|nr:LysM peptidoglycan-binding domain-containing protein [Mogibacterium sp.]
MKKRYKIVSPIRFFLFILIIVMTLAFTAATLLGSADIEAASAKSYRMVEVRINDTLWDIADRYCDPSEDPRILVREICDLNDIEPGELQAGDSILVPVQG